MNILNILNKLIKKEKNKKYNIKKNIIILGKNNLEKINFIYLIIFYLINKNKKILLININEKNIIKELNRKEKLKENFEKISFKISNEKEKYNFENYILKNREKFNYILINIGYSKSNKKIKEILEKGQKIIYVMKNDFLEIKELLENKSDILKIAKNNNFSLHIININNYFFCISQLLIRRLCLKIFNEKTIYLKKKSINWKEKFIKNEKIKINYKNKKILEEILK